MEGHFLFTDLVTRKPYATPIKNFHSNQSKDIAFQLKILKNTYNPTKKT